MTVGPLAEQELMSSCIKCLESLVVTSKPATVRNSLSVML